MQRWAQDIKQKTNKIKQTNKNHTTLKTRTHQKTRFDVFLS